jgi:hypothetical protein
VDCGGVCLQAAGGSTGVGGNSDATVGLPTGIRIGVEHAAADASAFLGVERAAANTGTRIGARVAAAIAASVGLG